MPLQKPRPQGTPSATPHSLKRQQLQGRRRTLHTISELSVTDGAAPDLDSFIANKRKEQRNQTNSPGIGKRNQNLNKRRSLPQHCSAPKFLQTQALVTEQSTHTSVSHRSQSTQAIPAVDTSKYEAGWNARRERARIQREQAVCEATSRRQPLSPKPQDGSYPILPQTAPRESSQSNLGSYASHRHLLRNSRSITGSRPPLDRQASLGTTAAYPDHRGYDTESSEKASTDFNSYHSTHESAVRRSRSGSSSDQSFTSQATPPMPVVLAPPAYRYYTSPNLYSEFGTGVGQAVISRHSSNSRTSSLPCMHNDSKPPNHTSSRSCTMPAHQVEVQRARLESLAALTAGPTTTRRRTSSLQKSSTPHHRDPFLHNRPLSHSNLKPMPQCSSLPTNNTNTTTINTSKIIVDKNPDKLRRAPEFYESRSLPKRESLTQWKAERDEARAEFDGMRRADMKERVRRANQLEGERERELLKVGKGTGTGIGVEGKEKERGCFGGLVAVFGFGGK